MSNTKSWALPGSRWAAVALVKAQALWHHGAQTGKVGAGGGTFVAAQAFQVAGSWQVGLLFLQLVDGLGQGIPRLGVAFAQRV